MKNKLNNKGMTLVEIILSIGLVSIVMVQVLNLLVDLKDEQILGQDKTNDLANRSIIMRTIEEEFTNNRIYSIETCPASTSSTTVTDDPSEPHYIYKSCLKIKYESDRTQPRFLITASDMYKKNDFFIFGKSLGNENATKPDDHGFEAWRLTTGKYPVITPVSCGFIFNAFPLTAENNGFSRYVRINYPVYMTEAYSNTMMTFDLEFMYYFRGDSDDLVIHTSDPFDGRGISENIREQGKCNKVQWEYE